MLSKKKRLVATLHGRPQEPPWTSLAVIGQSYISARQGMAVAAGRFHTAAVREDGALFVWGSGHGKNLMDGLADPDEEALFVWDLGTNGRLGFGDTNTPTRVAGLPAPVRQVAASCSHTGIVTDDGDLLICGGWNGSSGLGYTQERLPAEASPTTPTLVERALFDGPVLMVACGHEHTAVLTETGGVFTFGCVDGGRLGLGFPGHVDPWQRHEPQLTPRRVPAAAFKGQRIVMVAADGGHTVALSEKGQVYTWGEGSAGQLGHNNLELQWSPRQVNPKRFGGETVVFVAAGGCHTVAVTGGGCCTPGEQLYL